MGEAVAAPQIRAVEIHDLDERNVLAFDLPELLDALGERAFALDWIVTDYVPVTEGEEVTAFADEVYKLRPRPRERVSDSRAASSAPSPTTRSRRSTVSSLAFRLTRRPRRTSWSTYARSRPQTRRSRSRPSTAPSGSSSRSPKATSR